VCESQPTKYGLIVPLVLESRLVIQGGPSQPLFTIPLHPRPLFNDLRLILSKSFRHEIVILRYFITRSQALARVERFYRLHQHCQFLGASRHLSKLRRLHSANWSLRGSFPLRSLCVATLRLDTGAYQLCRLWSNIHAFREIGNAIMPSTLLSTSSTKRKRGGESKFYAVREGRNPGIYHTWDDCLEQVKGHKGAVCIFP
jgi:hypothetical protein